MLTSQDKLKLGRAQKSLLEAFQQAGEAGLDSHQIVKVGGISGSARKRELEDMGFIFKKERVEDQRLLYRYTLQGFSASNQIELFSKVA